MFGGKFKVFVVVSWNFQYCAYEFLLFIIYGQIEAIISKFNGNFPFMISEIRFLTCIIKYESRTNGTIYIFVWIQ